MALNDNDLFLVNQGGESKKLTYAKLKENIDADGIAGVSKIVAGDNITIDPAGGTGVVTINGQAGGGGGGGGDTIINYNGAAAWGVIRGGGALDAGLNCTATRNSQGNYSVTFINPMPSANYAITTGNLQANSIVEIVSQNANGFNYLRKEPSSGTLTDLKTAFAVHATNALPPKGGTGADAWINADGTTGAVLGSFNCTCAKVGTGEYEITFNSPMPDANYASVATLNGTNTDFGFYAHVSQKTANACRVYISSPTGPAVDKNFSLVIHATNATLPNTITEDQIAALIQNPALSAWGSIQADGTIDGSFNIASVTNSATGQYDVVFVNPMPNANYAVTATEGSTIHKASIGGKTTTGFSVFIRNTSGAAHTIENGSFNFQVASTARNGTLGGGADAWGQVDNVGTLAGGFNCTVSTTVKPDGTVVAAATGVRYVTFTNPMPNANYSVPTSNAGLAGGGNWDVSVADKLAQGFTVWVRSGNGDPVDQGFDFSVFATDGNAGGFWVRTDDELAPINDAIDVKIGGGNSAGVVLTSPNGTEYRVVVADDGTLSTNAV